MEDCSAAANAQRVRAQLNEESDPGSDDDAGAMFAAISDSGTDEEEEADTQTQRKCVLSNELVGLLSAAQEQRELTGEPAGPELMALMRALHAHLTATVHGALTNDAPATADEQQTSPLGPLPYELFEQTSMLCALPDELLTGNHGVLRNLSNGGLAAVAAVARRIRGVVDGQPALFRPGADGAGTIRTADNRELARAEAWAGKGKCSRSPSLPEPPRHDISSVNGLLCLVKIVRERRARSGQPSGKPIVLLSSWFELTKADVADGIVEIPLGREINIPNDLISIDVTLYNPMTQRSATLYRGAHPDPEFEYEEHEGFCEKFEGGFVHSYPDERYDNEILGGLVYERRPCSRAFLDIESDDVLDIESTDEDGGLACISSLKIIYETCVDYGRGRYTEYEDYSPSGALENLRWLTHAQAPPGSDRESRSSRFRC